MRILAFALLALVLLRADMYPDASNAVLPTARVNLGIAPAGTLWSSLGVVADGVTDNTAALNALPANTPIVGDCKGGSFIRVNDTWMLKSNLNIKVLPDCRMVSYKAGLGTYALSQTDLQTPLTNITIDGLYITKDAQRGPIERIIFAWIDHFKMLRWTVPPPNSGWAYIRGSCQEIAYNTHATGAFIPGADAIRHIGNIPKVVDGCNQIADVWIHDNNIIAGDGAYQACQPLNTSIWVAVSSDDMLFEKNTGVGSSYAIIGNEPTPPFNAYTCSNITYRNNVGGGRDYGYLIASNGALVSNILIANQSLHISSATPVNPGGLYIRGQFTPGSPGSFSNITFSGVSVRNTHIQAVTVAVPSAGTMNGLTIKGGVFDTPNTGTQPTISIQGGTNVTLQNNIIHGARASGASVVVGLDNGASDPYTVTNLSFIDNLIDRMPLNSAGLSLKNAASPIVEGNVFSKTPGVAGTVGIHLNNAYALPTSGTGPGTTSVTINGNTINEMATPITWTCNGGSTSVAVYNIGDAGHTCP